MRGSPLYGTALQLSAGQLARHRVIGGVGQWGDLGVVAPECPPGIEGEAAGKQLVSIHAACFLSAGNVDSLTGSKRLRRGAMTTKTKREVELSDPAMETLLEHSAKLRCSPRHLLNHLNEDALARLRSGELIVRPARRARQKSLH